MKKIIALCLCLMLCVACFSGCDYFDNYVFTTGSYQTQYTFYKKYKPGMTKQEVFEQLGCPEGIVFADESYLYIEYEDRDDFGQRLDSDDSVAWSYTCHKLPDPAEPYSLYIEFSSENKITEVQFNIIPGG